MKKEVLIFENEFIYLETAFQYVNELDHNNELNFSVIVSSQDLKPFSSVSNYDLIIVDISLAKRSKWDGYGILRKLEELLIDAAKIVIMTANHRIRDSLNEKGINSNYRVLTKPIDIKDLRSIFQDLE